MPWPIPDYIPDELKAEIYRNGFKYVEPYAEHIKVDRQQIYNIFKGSPKPLQRYKCFAEYAGITMDQLVEMAFSEGDELDRLIENLLEKKNISVHKLEIESGLGKNGIKNIREKRFRYLRSYFDLSKAIGWSLERFSEVRLKS